jgi:putative SOS response-associated peptidase YedK
MCGRFVLASSTLDIIKYLSAHIEPEFVTELKPSWNVPPTTNILAVTADSSGRRTLKRLRWGLVPPWAKDLSFGANTINARAETVSTKPSFRSAFRSQRCIIPADGYYEWKTTPGEVKQPYYFTRADGTPLAFAGVWERWQMEGTSQGSRLEILTCAIITTAANSDVAEIHHRMPVILEKGDGWGRWLDGSMCDEEELLGLCRPSPPTTLTRWRVASTVNNVRNDGPELIEALLERPSLF